MVMLDIQRLSYRALGMCVENVNEAYMEKFNTCI